MSIFSKKQKLNETALNYINDMNKFVENSKDASLLNLLFTEITILRMKLDKHDSFISNIKDAKKRKESINKKDLIKVQFYDICENYNSYSIEEIKEIDKIMNNILPKELPAQQNKSKSFWDLLKECFNNATGKH